MAEVVNQHKRMAMGENVLDADDFGVQKLASMDKGGAGGKTNTILSDAQRAAGLPIDGNQANPQHNYK